MTNVKTLRSQIIIAATSYSRRAARLREDIRRGAPGDSADRLTLMESEARAARHCWALAATLAYLHCVVSPNELHDIAEMVETILTTGEPSDHFLLSAEDLPHD